MPSVKIALIQRVITPYRLPAFIRLSKIENFDLTAFHGPNFKGTKVENAANVSEIKSKQLWSIPIKLNSKNGLVAMPFSPGLFFNLIKHNPDVIICEGASNIVNTSIAFIYKFIFRKKIIWWSLGKVPNREKSSFRKVLDNWIITLEKKSNAIIAYNSHAKKYFEEEPNVDAKKIFVALNVIDTEKRLQEIQKVNKIELYEAAHKSNDFIVIYVGAIIFGKKLDILLEAFKKLESNTNKKVKLTIVGKGQAKQELELLAKKLEIQNIEFVGEVLNGVSKYFLEADVFVLPGLGGLAIPDAMVHSLPVIASSADGSECDFIDGNNGLIIPEINAEKLYEVLSNWSNDAMLVNKMKKNALETILHKYNIHTFLKQIENAVYFALNSKAKS